MSSTGVRKRSDPNDRAIQGILDNEQQFVQRMKVFNASSPASGFVATGDQGGTAPDVASAFLASTGAIVSGAIGYVQSSVELVNEVITVSLQDFDQQWSSFVTPVNAVADDILDILDGGDYDGQILKMRIPDLVTQFIVHNGNKVGNTGNILMAGINDLVATGGSLLEFIFDTTTSPPAAAKAKLKASTLDGVWRLAGTGGAPSGLKQGLIASLSTDQLADFAIGQHIEYDTLAFARNGLTVSTGVGQANGIVSGFVAGRSYSIRVGGAFRFAANTGSVTFQLKLETGTGLLISTEANGISVQATGQQESFLPTIEGFFEPSADTDTISVQFTSSVSVAAVISGLTVGDPTTYLIIEDVTSGGGGGSGGGGSGSDGHVIEDEGLTLPQRANLNFVGAGVEATDDVGNNATVVTIAGGGAGGEFFGPWTANHDAGTFGLLNLSEITFITNANDQLKIKARIAGGGPDFDTIEYDADLGGGHDFFVNRVVTVNPIFGMTQTDINANVPLNMFGGAGAMADSGRVRFQNNFIGFAWRSVTDAYNIEVRTDLSNIFDITNSGNATQALQVRATHVTEPENTLQLSINPGDISTVTADIITNVGLLNLSIGGTDRLLFDVTTNTQMTLKSPAIASGTPIFEMFRDAAGLNDNVVGDVIFQGNTTNGATKHDFARIRTFERVADEATRRGEMQLLVTGPLNSMNGTTYLTLSGVDQTVKLGADMDADTFDVFNVDVLGFANDVSTFLDTEVGIRGSALGGIQSNILDTGGFFVTHENTNFFTLSPATDSLTLEGAANGPTIFLNKTNATTGEGSISQTGISLFISDEKQINLAIGIQTVARVSVLGIDMGASSGDAAFINNVDQLGFRTLGNFIEDTISSMEFRVVPNANFTFGDNLVDFAFLDKTLLALNAMPLQLAQIANPGNTTTLGLSKLFVDNSNQHLSVIGNTGGVVDLETGGGEINDGANVGTGADVFRDKTGVTLNFKRLNEGSGISISGSADTVTIAADGGLKGTIEEALWTDGETDQFDFFTYHSNSNNNGFLDQMSLPEDLMFYVPLFIAKSVRIFRMAVRIPSSGGGSYNLAFGIYANRTDGQNYPETLVAQSQTFFSGAGIKSILMPNTLLTPGLYWLAVVCTSNGNQGISSYGDGDCISVGWAENGNNFDPITGYIFGQSSTSLPNTAPDGAVTILNSFSVTPAIFARFIPA